MLRALTALAACLTAAAAAPWTPDLTAPLSDEWVTNATAPLYGELSRYNADVPLTSFGRNGTLVLLARPAEDPDAAYIAPRLVSRRSFQLGTLRVVARLPKRPGLWPLITLRPEAGDACRYPDDAGHCSDPSQGELEVVQTVGSGAQFPYVLRGVHLGRILPRDGAEVPCPVSGSPEQVPTGWWDEPHTFDLVRNASGVYWLVDGEPKQQLTPTDVADYLLTNANRPASYARTALAPFDGTNPLRLVLSLGVGGSLPCRYCAGCCPKSRDELIADPGVNHRPYPELVIHSIEFTPLEVPEESAGPAPPKHPYQRMTGALAIGTCSILALWAYSFTMVRRGARYDPGHMHGEVWLFENQQQHDTLIYGTSVGGAGAMKESFAGYPNSQLGTSPFGTGSMGSQGSDLAAAHRWGMAI